MASTDIIKEYKSGGFTVILYANRLEYKLPGGMFGKKGMIPYRNIANIEKPPLLNAIDIKTNDGKTIRLTMLNPAKTREIKEQIEALL